MKKILLTILTIGILAFLVYWGTEMYQFADGVKKDAVRLENFKLGQSIQNGDIIFQTSQSSQSKAISIVTWELFTKMTDNSSFTKLFNP
jgi:ASC-1-like (ASCH) protein